MGYILCDICLLEIKVESQCVSQLITLCELMSTIVQLNKKTWNTIIHYKQKRDFIKDYACLYCNCHSQTIMNNTFVVRCCYVCIMQSITHSFGKVTRVFYLNLSLTPQSTKTRAKCFCVANRRMK